MSGSDFTAGFTVQESPEDVFSAINNVRGWWSGDIEGSTDSLGDVFTYRYEDVHYSKQRITEMVPSQRVVWLIEDSYLKFVDEKNEWNGPEWSLRGRQRETALNFGSRITVSSPRRMLRRLLERVGLLRARQPSTVDCE